MMNDRQCLIYHSSFCIHHLFLEVFVMLKAQDLLVPVDFSPCSLNALRVALGMAAPDGDVTLLHVIDQHFIEDCAAAGLRTTEAITAQLRTGADASYEVLQPGRGPDG